MSLLPDWWNRQFLAVEGGCVVVATAGVVMWAERFGGSGRIDQLLQGNRGAVYAAMASIFGSLLGFVITAVSIVITTSDSARFGILRGSPHYGTLWKTFMSAIRGCAVATISTLVGLAADRDKSPRMWVTYLCVFAVLYASVRMARCIWVFETIIKTLTVSKG